MTQAGRYETLHCLIADAVGTISLARPERGNSFDLLAARELFDAVIHLENNDGVRAILLRAAGASFSVGGDLEYFRLAGADIRNQMIELAGSFHAAIAGLSRCSKPVVIAVNGAAAGAGLSLSIIGDIVLASEKAKFAAAYTGVGLSPDGGLSFTLPRLIGVRRALEMILGGRTLNAAEAEAYGLITRVVPHDMLDVEALAVARKLAAGPTKALGAARRLLHFSQFSTLEAHLSLEAETVADMAAGQEAREGIAAFLEKRRPEFAV